MPLLQEHGRQAINSRTRPFIPGGAFTSGSTYDRLRHHLRLTETSVIFPVTDAD